MFNYKLLRDGGVLRSDGISFSPNKEVQYYKEYEKWLADGNTPEPAETPQEEADRIAEEHRKNEIKEVRKTNGLEKVTIQQAHDHIDNTLDSASTATETKEAIRTILKKMIPYILS